MTKSDETNDRRGAAERWRVHVERWRASGLTMTDYSERNGLRRSQLSAWKGKLEKLDHSARRAAARPAQRLVQLELPRAARPLVELRVDEDLRVSLQFHFGPLGGRDGVP